MTDVESYAAAVERAAETARGQAEAMAIIPDYRDDLLAQARTLEVLAAALRAGRERDMVLLDHHDDQPRRVLVIELPEQQKEE